MKFEIRLDAERIYDALQHADDEGGSNLEIIVRGTIDKKEKVEVNRIYLFGHCETEYIHDIL